MILTYGIAIVGFSLTLLTGLCVYRHKVWYHFAEVEAGRLYRSGALGRTGLRWAWRRYGIRTIVNLASEQECGQGNWYENEKQFCQERGIDLVHLALEPGQAPDAEQIRRFLAVSLSGPSQPVLLHCKQGVARTNMMVAVYLKERFGTPNERILRRLPLFGHSFHKPRHRGMVQFILNYRARNGGR